ncbi:Cellulose synthase A catalytic subunit 8 [Hibiscus syriacus]|uniref:Cellulose synthase n=1 Tax=Hibiscus syriacus TaxID=106335 RepID=A0A6A2WK89_HIBSY|nr:Cellulose synthase A catalytic subunit 8 [Hibiscus syriacus]
MESGVPVCYTCGEPVSLNANGESFVACHDCNFFIYKSCFEYELKEGRKACLRCGKPYDENLLDDVEKASDNRSTMAAHLDKSLDVGVHARHISSVSTLESEMTEENGNPIWKNRVKRWKEKKKKKKKTEPKGEREAQVPPEQQTEDKPRVPYLNFSWIHTLTDRPQGARDIEGNELPRLVRVSAVLTNAPFILNLDCDHYVNNSKVVNMKGLDGIQGPVYVGTACPSPLPHHAHGVAAARVAARPKRLLKIHQSYIEMQNENNLMLPSSTLRRLKIEWIYGSVTEDILTGFKMHCRGWRSIYCMPLRPAFKGSAPHQCLIGCTKFFDGLLDLWKFSLAGIAPYGMALEAYPKLTLHHIDDHYLSNLASILFLGLSLSINLWFIGGVSAHLFAVFQGFLKMLAGIDTNFTVIAKAAEEAELGELYIVKWTTLLTVNMVGVVAGFSDALNKGYDAWGPLWQSVFLLLDYPPSLSFPQRSHGSPEQNPNHRLFYGQCCWPLSSLLSGSEPTPS